MNLSHFNELDVDSAIDVLRQCCGSTWWCDWVSRQRPFLDVDAFCTAADAGMDQMSDDDWIEAFSCHPKIGDTKSPKMRDAGNRKWSAVEQSGISKADADTIDKLAAANEAYEDRFGYVFIVCATGKTAEEMLSLLIARLDHSPNDELRVAAAEQRKITHLRIDKLLS